MRTAASILATTLQFGVVIVQTTCAQQPDPKRNAPLKSDSKVTKDEEAKGMIISAIQFTFAAKDADKAETLLREIRDSSVKEPGVVRFEVGRSTDDPNVFVLWEVYRDQAAVDAHRASEHFKRLVLDGIRPLAQNRTAVSARPIDE
jgi:quinol monooxygenase YgiN